MFPFLTPIATMNIVISSNEKYYCDYSLYDQNYQSHFNAAAIQWAQNLPFLLQKILLLVLVRFVLDRFTSNTQPFAARRFKCRDLVKGLVATLEYL